MYVIMDAWLRALRPAQRKGEKGTKKKRRESVLRQAQHAKRREGEKETERKRRQGERETK